MNEQNELVRAALCNALGALFILDTDGARVKEVAVRDGEAIIFTDRMPARAIDVRRVPWGTEVVDCGCTINGCTVRWTESGAAR